MTRGELDNLIVESGRYKTMLACETVHVLTTVAHSVVNGSGQRVYTVEQETLASHASELRVTVTPKQDGDETTYQVDCRYPDNSTATVQAKTLWQASDAVAYFLPDKLVEPWDPQEADDRLPLHFRETDVKELILRHDFRSVWLSHTLMLKPVGYNLDVEYRSANGYVHKEERTVPVRLFQWEDLKGYQLYDKLEPTAYGEGLGYATKLLHWHLD